jgi:hypothetical protein
MRPTFQTGVSISNPGRATQDRELRDNELDAVSGGLVVNAVIAVLIHLLLPSDVGTKPV